MNLIVIFVLFGSEIAGRLKIEQKVKCKSRKNGLN